MLRTFNLLLFAMSIITQEETFPGVFQRVTNCNNSKHISPLPASSNLENVFALFQKYDAKWADVFERIYRVNAQLWGPGHSAKPRHILRNQPGIGPARGCAAME